LPKEFASLDRIRTNRITVQLAVFLLLELDTVLLLGKPKERKRKERDRAKARLYIHEEGN
jgi:hypothetical protein